MIEIGDLVEIVNAPVRTSGAPNGLFYGLCLALKRHHDSRYGYYWELLLPTNQRIHEWETYLKLVNRL